MIVTIADTHAVIWQIYADSRLSQTASSYIQDAGAKGQQIGVSSITLVEMVYLIERQRIALESFTRLCQALESTQTAFTEIPIDLNIARALSRIDAISIPDMPDRIIAASAQHLNVPVITRDTRISASGMQVIW